MGFVTIDKNNFEEFHTREDLKKFYPNSKEIGINLSHTVFEIKPGLYCKAYFRTINGDSLKERERFHMKEIDPSTFDIDYFWNTKE